VHLTKFASPADLLGALAIALSGDLVVLPRSYPVSASRPSRPSGTMPLLTRREQEILSLVAFGHTDRAISEILWVAEQTVKFHMATVFRKLEVSGRADAVEQARRLGLIGE
jgi:DNA-binding CsgD family transcriptional regulator